LHGLAADGHRPRRRSESYTANAAKVTPRCNFRCILAQSPVTNAAVDLPARGGRGPHAAGSRRLPPQLRAVAVPLLHPRFVGGALPRAWSAVSRFGDGGGMRRSRGASKAEVGQSPVPLPSGEGQRDLTLASPAPGVPAAAACPAPAGPQMRIQALAPRVLGKVSEHRLADCSAHGHRCTARQTAQRQTVGIRHDLNDPQAWPDGGCACGDDVSPS
jgi:hypothetical protein